MSNKNHQEFNKFNNYRKHSNYDHNKYNNNNYSRNQRFVPYQPIGTYPRNRYYNGQRHPPYNRYPNQFHGFNRPNARPYRPPGQGEPAPAPFLGSEEHEKQKIAEASDMIKQQLSMPAGAPAPAPPAEPAPAAAPPPAEAPPARALAKRADAAEIHEKIINHITKLSRGRKLSFIAASSSGCDAVIEEIQTQRRLALSKALRELCSEGARAGDGAIVPDFGIDVGRLPMEVIQALNSRLGLGLGAPAAGTEAVRIKEEPCNFDAAEFSADVTPKLERIDEAECLYLDEQVDDGKPAVLNEAGSESQAVGVAESAGDLGEPSEVGTQTEDSSFELEVKECSDLTSAINIMFRIDKEIRRLTKLRQLLFQNKRKLQLVRKPVKKKTTPKKGKKQTAAVVPAVERVKYAEAFKFEVSDKIVAIKIINATAVVGSDAGRVRFYDLENSGAILAELKVSVLAITSFCHAVNDEGGVDLFVGSFDASLTKIDLLTRMTKKTKSLSQSVLCMEANWGCIFIGTVRGLLIRYSLKTGKIEFEEEIAENRVLVLKAALEGARRVLLVGTRNSPDGSLVKKYEASQSKGVSCLIVTSGLLFAGCYNGFIYVYCTKSHDYKGQIDGPGGVILSMDIKHNLIIVATMSFQFTSILIPDHFFDNNK